MIKHIVIWKLHDFAEGASKDQNARRMKKWLEELKVKIPQIRFLEVGINFNQNEDAYDVILYSEFDNQHDLHLYQAHPEHVKFKERIQSLKLDKKVIDYQI